MKITEPKKLTKLQLAGLLIVFFIIGLVMLVFPVMEFKHMISDINARSEYIILDKGMYYLPGGGLLFLLISLIPLIAWFVKDSAANKFGKIFFYSMIGCVVGAFILPYLVEMHYDQKIRNMGYFVCEARSYQWLHAKKIVYTRKMPCKPEVNGEEDVSGVY